MMPGSTVWGGKGQVCARGYPPDLWRVPLGREHENTMRVEEGETGRWRHSNRGLRATRCRAIRDQGSTRVLLLHLIESCL